MKLYAQVLGTAALAAFVTAAWVWSVDQADDPPRARGKRAASTPVLTETVALADDIIEVRAIGTAKAIRSATIHASVAGEVMAVAFRAGQAVSKGEVLVQLDDDHQRLAVQLAEVTVKEARRQVERLERLAPSGAASVAGLLTAQSELESALLNQARAKEALADRTVAAPFDGVMGLTTVEPGDRIDESMPIATLDDRSSVLIQFNIPEDYAWRISVGDPVDVEPWTRQNTLLQARISALDSRIDQTSRSLRVEATVPNRDDAIRPGTSFEVRKTFVGEAYPNVHEVAVLWSRDGAYVWRDSEGKAEKVFVSVVRRDKGRILVDGPLRVGDSVVVEGVQGLRVGQALAATPFVETGASK